MLGLPRGTEWIIILLIVLLLFGPGRVGKVFGELGKGIKAFREGISKDKPDEEEAPSESSSNTEPK